jgi:hypothetical protein
MYITCIFARQAALGRAERLKGDREEELAAAAGYGERHGASVGSLPPAGGFSSGGGGGDGGGAIAAVFGRGAAAEVCVCVCVCVGCVGCVCVCGQ